MQTLNSLARREAEFVEPMECLAVSRLPDGVDWAYEIINWTEELRSSDRQRAVTGNVIVHHESYTERVEAVVSVIR